eukprot:Seg1925.3 transcript_id=Seg1925.3/GoldUCD/mRNA.D3Y31 product="hypothetical protein" protein_id=Seg1925.3/GoldUCD/D3Y31
MPFSFRDPRKKASADYTEVEESISLDEMETPLLNEEDTPLLGSQDKSLGCDNPEIDDEDDVLNDEHLAGIRSFFFPMKQTKIGSFALTAKDIERMVKEEMENYKEGRQMGENLDKIAKAKSWKISEDKKRAKERREALEKHAMAIEALKHLRKIQNRGNDIVENEFEDSGKRNKREVINSKEVESLSIACLKSYDKEVADCKDEIEMLTNKLEDTTNKSMKEISLLKSKCREFGKQRFELKNDNDRLEDEKEQLREMVNQKDGQINDMRMSLENERMEMEKLKRTYENSERTSTRQIRELEEQLEDISAEFEITKTQLKEKETWIKEEFRPIESRAVDNEVEDSLTKEMQQLCKSKRTCEKQQRVDQYEKEAGPGTDNEELMAGNFEALKKKAKRLLKEKSDAIKTLVNDLKQMKQQHERSTNDAQKELQITKGKLQISSKDMVSLKRRLKHYEADISSTRQNRQRVVDENTRLKKRLSETAVEYESLKGRIRDLESERNGFPNRRSSSEGILKKKVSFNLSQEEMEYVGQNDTRKCELSDRDDRAMTVIERDFQCTKCARTSHEVTQLMTVNQNMTEKLMKLAKDNKIFSDAANEHLDKRMVLQKDNRELQERIHVLKEEIEEAKISEPFSEMSHEYFDKQTALQKENGELRDKIRVLELEIKTVTMKYKTLLDTHSSLAVQTGMKALQTCQCTPTQTSDKCGRCSVSSIRQTSSLRTQTSYVRTVKGETFGMTSEKGLELARELYEFENFVHETLTVEKREMQEFANKIKLCEIQLEQERSEKVCKELADNIESMKKIKETMQLLMKENNEFRWNIKHMSILLKASERKEMKATKRVLKLRKLLKLEKENNQRKDVVCKEGSLMERREENHNGSQHNVNGSTGKELHARAKKHHQREMKRSRKESPQSVPSKSSEREFVIHKQDGILRQRNTGSENTGTSSGLLSTETTTSSPLSTTTATGKSSRGEMNNKASRNGTGNKGSQDIKRSLPGINDSRPSTGATSRTSTTETVTEGSLYADTDLKEQMTSSKGRRNGGTDNQREVAQRPKRISQNDSKEYGPGEKASQESEEFVNIDEAFGSSDQVSENSNEFSQGSESASKFSDEVSEDSNEVSENNVEGSKKKAYLSVKGYEAEETNNIIVAAKEMRLNKNSQLTLSELMYSNDDEISFSDWVPSPIESPRKESPIFPKLSVHKRKKEKALLRQQQEENEFERGYDLKKGPNRGSNHSIAEIMNTDSKTNLVKRKKSVLGGKTKYKKVNLSSTRISKSKKRREEKRNSSSTTVDENEEAKIAGSSTTKGSTTSTQSSGKSTSSSKVKKGKFAYFKRKFSKRKIHKQKKKSSSSDLGEEFEKEGKTRETKPGKALPTRYKKGIAQGVQNVEKVEDANKFADDSEGEDSSDEEAVSLITRRIVKGEEPRAQSSGKNSKFKQEVSNSEQGVMRDKCSYESSDSEEEEGNNKMRVDQSSYNNKRTKKKFSKISISWIGFGSKKKKKKGKTGSTEEEMIVEKESETVGESLEKVDKKVKTKEDKAKMKEDKANTKDDKAKTKDDNAKTKGVKAKTKDDKAKTKDDKAKKKEDKASKSADKDAKKAAKKEKKKAKKEKEKAKIEAKMKEKAEKKRKQYEDAKQKQEERENEQNGDLDKFEKQQKKRDKERKKKQKKEKKIKKAREKSEIKLQKELERYRKMKEKAEKKLQKKQEKEEQKKLKAGKKADNEKKEENKEEGAKKSENSMIENGKDLESKTANEVERFEDNTGTKVEQISTKDNEKEITEKEKTAEEPNKNETQASATDDVIEDKDAPKPPVKGKLFEAAIDDVMKDKDAPKPPVKGKLFEDAPEPTTIKVTSSDDSGNNKQINFMPGNQSPAPVADHVTAFSPRPDSSDDDAVPRDSLVVFKPSAYLTKPQVIDQPKGLSSLVATTVGTPRKEKEEILVIDTGEDDFDWQNEENEEPVIESANNGTKTTKTMCDNEVGDKTKAKETIGGNKMCDNEVGDKTKAKETTGGNKMCDNEVGVKTKAKETKGGNKDQNAPKKTTVARRPRTSEAYESFWAASDDEFDFESPKDVKNCDETMIKEVEGNNEGNQAAPVQQEKISKEKESVFEFLLNDLDTDEKKTKREEGQTIEHYDNLFQEIGNAEVQRPASTGMPKTCDYRGKKAAKGDLQQRGRKGENDEEVDIDDLLDEFGMDDESQNQPAVQPWKNNEQRGTSDERASRDSKSKKKQGIVNNNDSEIDMLFEEFGMNENDQGIPEVQATKKESKYSGSRDLKSNKQRGKLNNEEKSIDDLLADLGMDE